MALLNILVFVIFVNITIAKERFYFKEKPDYIKTCKKSNPNFGECSRAAVQGMFDILTVGIPEIEIEPLDPLKVSKVTILQGGGPVSVNAYLTDVTIFGFGKTEVIVSEVDEKHNYDFFTQIKIPKIRVEGTYNLRGQILVLPLVGKGDCWFEPTDLNIDIFNEVMVYKRDEFAFFNITATHVKFSIGGLTFRMNNLFDGIKALENPTNAYLNANWRPVAESLNPILARTVEDIMIVILRKFFHSVPANFMIEDIKVPDNSL